MVESIHGGETIVADRYYGLEYGFLEELRKMGVAFVIRLRSNPLIEIIDEMPLAAADGGVGINCQEVVRLGVEWRANPCASSATPWMAKRSSSSPT